jgi:hypothetical protein
LGQFQFGVPPMRDLIVARDPATCPVRAWRGWLEVSGITEGHAFCPVDRHGHIGTTRLSGQAVALVLKRHAAGAVGL